MKYNGFYFWMFRGSMKRVLAEKYGKAYAAEILRKSKGVYRRLVEQADDIGADNPMAYNELFALAFVAPYIASEKKDPAGDRAGDDAPRALPYPVIFCADRPEHRPGQGGEQKEHREIRPLVHAGNAGKIPKFLPGGFCGPAL